MNICMLSMETIFHKYGGVETYVHQLSKHLVSKGQRVFVISMSTDSYRSFIADGVNYIMIPIRKIKLPLLSMYLLQMLLFNIKAAITVKKLNQKCKLNVVHAQFCCGFFYALLRLLSRDKAKFIVTLHGTLVDERRSHWRKSLSSFLLIIMEYISVKCADGIIASSYDTLRSAIRHYRIKGKKAAVIYSGVNLERFNINELRKEAEKSYSETFNVLYVGRADERKGIRFLLEAASILVSKYQNICFFLVGPGTESCSFYRKDLRRFFVLAGTVPEETLIKYYLISDVFVLPSLYEGFGLVVIEAFAAGKPVIAFKVSSLPELVESGKNGILLESFNSNELAHAIETLMKNDSLRRKMGFHAKETAKKFTWSATSDKTMDFYMKSVSEPFSKR